MNRILMKRKSKMNKEKIESKASNTVEDLALNETAADQVKGGASDYLLEIDGIKGESCDHRHNRR
jgi:hypothetical protein